jgi:DNA-binding NtrC family response regulator
MAAPTRPRLHLLLVDDDDQLRQTLVRRFQRQGVTVTEAPTGAAALAKANQTRQDVALLDLHLPDMTGIDLLAQLKERQPELEALMLTAHGSIETAIQAMKRGAYDYLTKPFHLPELEVQIEKAFEKVRLAAPTTREISLCRVIANRAVANRQCTVIGDTPAAAAEGCCTPGDCQPGDCHGGRSGDLNHP